MAGNRWKLEGYDTFAGEVYPIEGTWRSQEAAEKAAATVLKKLEKQQPPLQSGGQEGIQDQVYIIRPDGTRYRYLPGKGDDENHW